MESGNILEGIYIIVHAIVLRFWSEAVYAERVASLGDEETILTLVIVFVTILIKALSRPFKSLEDVRFGFEIGLGCIVALIFFWISVATMQHNGQVVSQETSIAHQQLYLTPLLIVFFVMLLFSTSVYTSESGWRTDYMGVSFMQRPVLGRGVLLPNFIGLVMLVVTVNWITYFFKR